MKLSAYLISFVTDFITTINTISFHLIMTKIVKNIHVVVVGQTERYHSLFN